ncbi:MAG: LPXTG cell wall anchor domain-containing protein [Patescibacteria group bacterium]
MKTSHLIYSILAILFGAFMVVYGGVDDSPGGQLLGLVLVIGGIVFIVRSKKKNS